MSEYDPAVAQRYTELLAPAFVEGLSSTVVEPQDKSAPPLSRLATFVLPVIARVQQVDWEASGLPVKQYSGSEDPLKPADQSPDQYAELLTKVAFADAEEILRLCEDFDRHNGLPSDASLPATLLNSKKTLLDVALLPDLTNDMFLRAQGSQILTRKSKTILWQG